MTKCLETYDIRLNSVIPTGDAHYSYTTKALAGGPAEHFNLEEEILLSALLRYVLLVSHYTFMFVEARFEGSVRRLRWWSPRFQKATG